MKTSALILLSTLVSCGIYDGKGALDFSFKVEEPIRSDEVNFKVLQEKILPKCIGCHGNWTSEEALADLITPGDPDNSPFYDSVKTGWMPQNSPPLTTAQLEVVRSYINNLRVTTTTAPDPAPVPTPAPAKVTFKDLQEKVFQVSCLPCHSRTLNQEATLMKWIDTDNPDESPLLIETESRRMPKGRDPLTEAQLTLIRSYVNNFR